MTQAIRLSPSGPVIANSGGGPFAPGPGASLRLVEAQCTIGGSLAVSTVPQVIGPTLGAAFPVALPNPDPNKNYRVTAILDVFNLSTNVTASCELYIDTSTDGVTFVERRSNTHLVGFNGGRQVRCDMALISGALLGVTAGVTALSVQARIGASAGNPNLLAESAATPGDPSHTVGTVLLQLQECF